MLLQCISTTLLSTFSSCSRPTSSLFPVALALTGRSPSRTTHLELALCRSSPSAVRLCVAQRTLLDFASTGSPRRHLASRDIGVGDPLKHVPIHHLRTLVYRSGMPCHHHLVYADLMFAFQPYLHSLQHSFHVFMYPTSFRTLLLHTPSCPIQFTLYIPMTLSHMLMMPSFCMRWSTRSKPLMSDWTLMVVRRRELRSLAASYSRSCNHR